jgi:2-dehydro-3-deoxyphosphogluconate aldolase/(4S)-4-hydroxy-2-oxoglutarate aldolase
MKMGVTTVKFFPSEALGGIGYINAVGAPFPQVRFVPTGGVNPGNLAAYLSSPRVAACGGSWLAKSDMVKSGQFDQICELARQAVAVVEGIAAE